MREPLALLFMLIGLSSCREFVVRREMRSLVQDENTDPGGDSSGGGDGPAEPEVSQLHVESSIRYRYAHTRVTSRVANWANTSQEVLFDMLLPDTAFITSFLMEVEGKQYKAFLREKDVAKKEYEEAVASGVAAAHVHVNARNSNRFTISVNVEGSSKSMFVLTYEELLTRSLGLYSHVISLTPTHVVRDLLVDVFIAEPSNIIELHVPKIKSSNEVSTGSEGENDLVEIRRPNPMKAHIRYRPSIEEQMKNLGGQLIVRYDVERTTEPGGQILVNDGYFVHFFAPEGLPPLRKLAIFVLDLSGSMEGRKVEQLKTAMSTILDDLGKRDHFNIIDFSYSVTVHNLDSPAGSVVLPPDTAISKTADIPPPYPISEEYIAKAKQVIGKMSSGGGTNIYDALKNAIIVAQSGVEKIKNEKGESDKEDTLEPIIIFLTDGDPTVGITKHARILSMVKEYNNPRTSFVPPLHLWPDKLVSMSSVTNEEVYDQLEIVKARLMCSIFSLGFGHGADMRFLRRLSLGNAGFARSIYEASDAALQLSNFYKEVASPLLSNVTFSYLPGQVMPGSMTKGLFSSLFLGSELVVAGKLNGSDIDSKVEGTTVNGTASFQAKPLRNIPDDIDTIEYTEDDKTTEQLTDELKGGSKQKKKIYLKTNLERLWAYLTIQQLSDQLEAAEGNQEVENEIRKKAVSLALKYKFVTPFTSLVVVKPNKTVEITSEKLHDSDSSSSHKTKFHYLQGALYGFPLRYPSSIVDMMASQPGAPFPSTTIDRIDAGESSEDVDNSSTEEDYSMTESGSTLYLEDITWFSNVFSWENSTIALPRGKNNDTETYLFVNNTTGDDHGENCTLTDNIEGVCRHVVDCILPQYAGACCPELVDTSTSFYYPSSGSSESSESWTEPATSPQTD